MRRLAVAVAALAVSASARAAAPVPPAIAAAPAEPAEFADTLPDLGTIRYHDPSRRREIQLGLEGGGIAVPARTSGIGRTVWTAWVGPSWAIALAPRVALGGRHAARWYDVENARLRAHEHALELSAGLVRGRPRLRDRVAVGVESHEVKLSIVDGIRFRVGGIRDIVLHFGYGMEHALARRFVLGWRAHLRQVWVYLDTQRQVRLSVRGAFVPRPRHRLALELVGFYVNRDLDQAGEPLPQHSVHGQVALEYQWMSRHGVGPVVGARYATSFRAGEAPIFEVREDSLNTHYGEVFAGVRVVWR
jgi:hypothetical protein